MSFEKKSKSEKKVIESKKKVKGIDDSDISGDETHEWIELFVNLDKSVSSRTLSKGVLQFASYLEKQDQEILMGKFDSLLIEAIKKSDKKVQEKIKRDISFKIRKNELKQYGKTKKDFTDIVFDLDDISDETEESLLREDCLTICKNSGLRSFKTISEGDNFNKYIEELKKKNEHEHYFDILDFCVIFRKTKSGIKQAKEFLDEKKSLRLYYKNKIDEKLRIAFDKCRVLFDKMVDIISEELPYFKLNNKSFVLDFYRFVSKHKTSIPFCNEWLKEIKSIIDKWTVIESDSDNDSDNNIRERKCKPSYKKPKDDSDSEEDEKRGHSSDDGYDSDKKTSNKPALNKIDTDDDEPTKEKE